MGVFRWGGVETATRVKAEIRKNLISGRHVKSAGKKKGSVLVTVDAKVHS